MAAMRAEITVEELTRRGLGRLPGHLGMEVVSVDERCLRMRMAIEPRHLAPNGYLHGATVVALADTAAGYGTMAHLPQGAQGFTTIELKTNFLGTVREGAIVCDATPVHLGRSTQVWDAEVRDEVSGRVMAAFRCTQIVLWPRS